MSKTKVIKFKNGATLIFKKKHSHNYTAVNIGYGSGYMVNEKNGSAHFLEHMLFKQTTNRNENQINEDRDKLCFMNAGTGPNSMFITFSRSNRLIEKSFAFASDLLLNTKLSNTYIQQEKGVITEERRNSNDKVSKDIYYQHSIIVSTKARVNDISLGTYEDIDTMTKKDLVSYKEKYYNAKNFICCIVGSISLFKAKRLLKKYVLDKLKVDDAFVPQIVPYICDKEPSMQIYKNTQEKTSVLISYKIDDNYNNTMLNFNYLAIGRYLNCNDTSMHVLLRKKGLIYSSNVNFAFSEYDGQIYIKIDTNKDKISKCLKTVSECIKNILNGCINDEDISLFKKNYDYNKDETVNPTYEKICSNLADEYVLKKKIIQIKQSQRDRAVKQMNKEEVLKTAQKVFVGNKPYVTFMGNLKEEDIPSYEEILKLLTF